MSVNPIEIVGDEFEMREVERTRRMNLYDAGKQGIFTDIATIKTPKNNPIITFSKRFERMSNSKESVNEVIVDAIDANEGNTVYDKSVRSKVEDIVFPYKEEIPLYGPLSDIESENMRIFITEEASDLIENDGVDLGLMREELSEISSIPVNKEQEDYAKATYGIRENIASIRRQMAQCQGRILLSKPQWKNLRYDEFIIKLVNIGDSPDCSKFLKLDAKLRKNKALIDQYSASIMAESLNEVYIPDCVSIEDVMLPGFDIMSGRFKPEKYSASKLDTKINLDIKSIPDIPNFNINDIINV